MNNKGLSVLMMVFEVLAVVIIITMVSSVAKNVANSETTEKINIGNEFQLMINSLVSINGNVVVAYPYNISKYDLVLGNDAVTVMKKGDVDVLHVIRDFSLPDGYSASGVVENSPSVCLEKSGKNIFIRNCKEWENTNIENE